MRPGVLVYLSGPITATEGYTVADNVASALAVYLDCIRRGVPSFCPQIGAAFPAAFTIDYETWMLYDFAVIDRCTHMLMLPRWETSSGAKREKDYAHQLGLPIVYSIGQFVRSLPIVDASGRYLADAPVQPPDRQSGPHDANRDAREPVKE